MLKLVRRARARLLRNELLAAAVNTASAALAACLILLVLGSDALRWEWLAVAPAAAAAISVYRAGKRTPSAYAVAQMVDRRMGLHDTLSTAFHFSDSGEPTEAGSYRWVRERADQLAPGVDLKRAVPYTRPRALYALGGLFLLVSSLFALRFAVTQRLNIASPLAAILPLNLGLTDQPQQAENKQPPQLDSVSPSDQSDGGQGGQRDRRDRVAGADQAQSASADGKAAQSERSASKRGDPAEASESSAERNAEGQADRQQDQANGQQGAEGSQTQGERDRQASAQTQSNNGNNSGLMDRVRNAMRSLMSRLNPPQQFGQPSQAQDRGQQGSRQESGRQTSNNTAGQPGNGARQQAQAQPRQGNADRAANGAAADGSAPGDGESRDLAGKPGNGAGSEDGAKDIREAEQLAAMGKISEIIGKRAADLSGEVTVEVESTNQQLRTPYASRKASHAAGGAEIGRDEVPVAVQSYVEQYFEMVRKQGKK